MQNLHEIDSKIRGVLGSLIIILAVIYQSYLLLVPAAYIIYSASKGHCSLYKLMGINKAFAIHNELVMQLPKHNPSPVFIFDDSGKILFRNNHAIKSMPHTSHLKDLWLDGIKVLQKIIENEEQHSISFENNEKYISVNFIGVKTNNIVVAYTQDITDIVKADQEIIQTQKEIVYTMGEIGETRSKETGNHVKRVAEYSALLAKKTGLDYEKCELIKMASPMHDIGKVGIPDSILNKPGKLNEEEWEIMKTHAQLGYEMLKHSDREILKASAIIAKEHHEKYDGNGYPNALKGDAIHIYARITAVADVFDALGSDRVYKKAWPMNKIIVLFEQESGKHFDPTLVKILLDELPLFLVIRDKFQDSILK